MKETNIRNNNGLRSDRSKDSSRETDGAKQGIVSAIPFTALSGWLLKPRLCRRYLLKA